MATGFDTTTPAFPVGVHENLREIVRLEKNGKIQFVPDATDTELRNVIVMLIKHIYPPNDAYVRIETNGNVGIVACLMF